MFYISPWYDEIYTYINFIDEGFLYSATHWPAPNNHIFFSMLSALINWCGNYIGLRGISYLAAIGTIIILYIFLKEIFSKNVSMITTLCYSMLLLTNKLAIQGRGYSLATFFLMVAVYCGYRICYKNVTKKEYIFWMLSLWFGLYTVVTSVYWVVAICLCCGIVLLILKKYNCLLKLILSSLIAAVMTLLSYAVMWFSIGAQQISNDVTSGYYGAKVWFLIKEFPRTCLMRGIEFMTSDRSVQGIERSAFLRDFKYFARDILSAFFGTTNMWYFYGLLVVISICFVTLLVLVFRKKNKHIFMLTLSSVGFFGIFIILCIQSAYPFTRVFSFLGIFIIMPIGLLNGLVAEIINKFVKWKHFNIVAYIFVGVFALYTGIKLMSPLYRMEYDVYDYYAYDAVKHIEWDNVGTYLVSDVYVTQQVEFHQIIGNDIELQVETDAPDIIITKKTTLTGVWPDVITDEALENCFISKRPILYENELYRVYGNNYN